LIFIQQNIRNNFTNFIRKNINAASLASDTPNSVGAMKKKELLTEIAKPFGETEQ
jgi:hypothetical protein